MARQRDKTPEPNKNSETKRRARRVRIERNVSARFGAVVFSSEQQHHTKKKGEKRGKKLKPQRV